MSGNNFHTFLLERKDSARQDFLDAKKELESFEQEAGAEAYYGRGEQEAGRLAAYAHQTYVAYRKAWVEWYAAINGYPLHAQPEQKDTPAFAAPAAEEWRALQRVDL